MLRLNTFFNVLSVAVIILIPVCALNAQEKQRTITGKIYSVSDSSTVPGAHVFLNGTTLGTYSDEHGTFILRDIPKGRYQLIIRSLGFKNVALELDSETLRNELNIYLEEDIYEMNEITVTSSRKEWQNHFNIFKRYFLGISENAQNSEILNPEVLNFDFDPVKNILAANASNSLKIRNEAIGYDIEFYLEHFSFDSRHVTYSYFGYPLYKELDSNRRRTKRKWNRNREQTYKGSFQHFINSLISDNYFKEGFEVKVEIRDNRNSEENVGQNGLTFSARGARYLSKSEVDIDDIFYQKDDNTYVLTFKDFLNITYKNEYESYEYRKWIRGNNAQLHPTRLSPQNSVITLRSDSLLIDKSGYLYNAKDIFFGGYWAFERLADLMPLDYKPED